MPQDPFAALAAARKPIPGLPPDTTGVTDRQTLSVSRPAAKAARPSGAERALDEDEQREHISFHIPRWVLRAVDAYRVRSASATHTSPAPRAEVLRTLLREGARGLGTREVFAREERTPSER